MSTGKLFIGLIFILIGLSALTNFDLFHYLIPVLFIFLGLKILTGSSWRHNGRMTAADVHADELNDTYIMSGTSKKVESANFTGGKAVVIFGAEEIDLRAAKSKEKNIDMELNAVFGGMKLIVPKTWTVNSQGTGVIGGFDNKTAPGEGIRLTVRGAAIFGGVEIVN